MSNVEAPLKLRHYGAVQILLLTAGDHQTRRQATVEPAVVFESE